MNKDNNKVLEIINVSKTLGKSKVIKKLNLTVNACEVFGFLGPNGAGKTTTIKMIVGFLSIDEGDILIDGYSIKKDFESAMRNIGGIVENPDLYDYLSGYDNLKLIARLYKVKEEKMDEVIELVGLKGRIKDKVKKYSLGMKQRLGLALALIRSPKLLILDEPTNGLDPEGIHELRYILKDLAHNKGICVFISSHLLSEIELMCDRVAIINKGEIIKVESISEVIGENDTSDKKEIYELNTNENEKAKIILASKNYELVQSNSDKINIIIQKQKVSEIIILLANNNILTYEVTKKKQSLEDDFLNITKGGSINV